MGAEDTYVSGSGLQRVDACEGSAALHKWGHSSGKADMGSAFHDHLTDRTRMTPGDAAARIPEHAAKWGLDENAAGILAARARNWEWQPPAGAMSEVALGLLEDGSVTVVRGGRGSYQGPPELRVATRVDLFWSEPRPLRAGNPPRCPPESLLWGIDLKTGVDTWVPPVERNLQALTACVLPAIWTGAKRAVCAIVFPTKGPGTWDALPAPLDEAGIFRARDLLLDVARRANIEREKARAGELLRLEEGPQCLWCESVDVCPKKLALVKTLVGAPNPFAGVSLTDDEAARLADLAPFIAGLARSADAALRAHAIGRGGPFPLRDGNVWGPYTAPKKHIDPWIGKAALAGVVGEPRAKLALKVSLSDKAIRAAVKELHDATGVERQGAPTVRAIYREIIIAGGLEPKTITKWGRHKPEEGTSALPPGGGPLLLGAGADEEIDEDEDD